MLKQRLRLIKTFATSCQVHQKLNYSSRRMFNNKDERPSDDTLFKNNIEPNQYPGSSYSKLKSAAPLLASAIVGAISLAIIYNSFSKQSREPLARRPFKKFNDPNKQFAFSGKTALLEDVINLGRMDSFLLKDIPSLLKKQKGLYVIVGESGIGKTEAFKYFVNEWKKQGFPGNYVDCTADTTTTTFLEECFETSNKVEIDEEIQRWIGLKQTPVLVVDNIHKLYKDGKFEPGILDFIKKFSDNGGKIFMLSSTSEISYKISHYSGYASRVEICEIRPREKATMERYIREAINPVLQNKRTHEEIALFVDYFDGNMAIANRLSTQENTKFEGNVLLNNNNLLHQ